MADNLWLGLMLSGTAANRPATPTVQKGGFVNYRETDTGVVSVYTTAGGWVVVESGAPDAGFAAALTAGTTQTLAGATPIVGGYANIAVCANASDGVALPLNPRVGQSCMVTNAGAAAAKVWPGEAASKIDGGTAGAGVTLTNVKSALFTCISVGPANWQSIGMATRSA